MNKTKRLEEIIKLVNKNGIVRISEIVNIFKVTDMTVRRDLAELEDLGLLKKIHGGARSNNAFQYKENSHKEKHTYNVEQKKYISQLATNIIEEGDSIFLGPGTTVEFLAEALNHTKLTVSTNCLPVFNILSIKRSENFRVILLGGEMREVTESFVGEISNTILENMRFSKIFFSANAVKDDDIMTSTFDEAYTQKLALNNSIEKYLLLDTSKIGKVDFTVFYKLSKITAVITDQFSEEKVRLLAPFTEIIN